LTREYKKIPVKRLIIRMGLTRYDCPAPLTAVEFKPKKVTIPLQQHIGAPAEPTVDVGEWVEKGAEIARTKEGALGANIHASISGVITAITDCIVIETRDREAAKEC
jgi:Na+-translocating ferredoxin:NAD+ oxidoreductase RnfC subunit